MDDLVKVAGIIQARISSNRNPAKAMLDLEGKTILERVVERVRLSTKIDEIWIATSDQIEDDLIENSAKKMGIKCFRGSLNNVLDRFYHTLTSTDADLVVRITADNPLTEPRLIDKAVSCFINSDSNIDYIGYRKVPKGSGVEVFTRESFMKLAQSADLTSYDKEHVTSYYYHNQEKFSVKFLTDKYTEKQASMEVSVDTLADYVKLVSIYKILEEKKVDVSDYLDKALSIILDN
ncbi:MAG: NTP transferase domain-containing protein [Bacillus sp. (in: firmicutes)]